MKNMFKFTIGLLSLVMCFSVANAEENKKAISKKEVEGKKLDIQDLEKKYWTPKDTTYNVVQNRTYGKEKRFALTLNGGLLLNDNFNDGFSFGANLNYYFNETHGVELNYISASHDDSDAVDIFKNELSSGTAPDFNRMESYIGLNYNFVPFYAKVSVLGKKIIYFDFAFSPGIGMVTYEQLTQDDRFNEKLNAIAFNFDITQHFFFSKHMAIRVDFRNMWYTEKILKFGGSTKTEKGSRSNNTSLLNIGLQYFF